MKCVFKNSYCDPIGEKDGMIIDCFKCINFKELSKIKQKAINKIQLCDNCKKELNYFYIKNKNNYSINIKRFISINDDVDIIFDEYHFCSEKCIKEFINKL